MVKHIALLCNPTAENAKSLRMAEDIALQLKMQAIAFSKFTAFWPQAWDGFSDIWIVGGDGTLNWFINENPTVLLPLSIFPAGSGNDFHWMLYGNLKPIQQVEQLLHGGTKWVDAGSCNGKLFINGVGIGFDGAIVKDLLGKRKIGGKGSYLLSIMKNILRYHEAHCRIETGKGVINEECFLISVANGKRYGGGFQVAPGADMTDGLLDLNIVGRISPLKRMRYLPVMEKGEHLNLSFVQYSQSDKVRIEAEIELPAHLDGEFMSAKVFQIECLPKRFLFSL